MQADIYGLPVVTVAATEGPAFGAALMAGVGAGVFGDLTDASDQFVKVIGATEPNPRHVAAYQESYALFQSLYPDLKAAFARAQALVERQTKETE
jgi:xylulokinase